MPIYEPVVGKVLQTNIGKISYASTFSHIQYDGSEVTITTAPQHIGTNLLPLLVGHEALIYPKTITDTQYGDISLYMGQWLSTSTVGGEVVYTGGVQIGYRYQGYNNVGVSVSSTVRMTHLGYAIWYNSTNKEVCAGLYIEGLNNDNTKYTQFVVSTRYTSPFNPEIKGLMYKLLIDELVSLNSYKPLYNLHSSNQNFTLTTIGKTPNDGSPQIVVSISDIMAFSEQSRLRAYIQNIKDNDRFVKMFTLDEHKYIGIKIDTYNNGVYEGKIGFYIDGVRQVALDLNFLSNSIFDTNNLFPYFLAISVDYANSACLPTIVYDWSDTGLTDYQCENYTAVNELYEYLHPFFGAVINPENPDIPVIDPTPTTDGETGGDGSWWTPDYEVGVPEIYEYGVADCGFMSLYRMTEVQMRNLASYLWSDDFLDNVKKFFNDPMQMIVCARMIPYTPNSAQNTSAIKAGNVDTTCVGYKIDSNNQYTKIDCGQVRVEPRGDTYMDYSPYCSASIYLPFVGVRPLDVDLIMGHDIGVEYNCDCLTGQSVCFVKIDKNVAYSYECTIGTDIPISSQSYGNVIGALSSALTMPISAGTMLATGGMSAPMMPTMLASASIGVTAGTSIAQATRETISHSGNVTGIGGMLSYKKPILYMEYTNPINAKNQKHFLGAPAHKNMVLKNCNGLTIVKQIFIELEEATDDEKKELSAILESGVIV